MFEKIVHPHLQNIMFIFKIQPSPPKQFLTMNMDHLQCCWIENQQSPIYVVNRVTLTGKNLYKKSYHSSELTIYVYQGDLDLSKEVLWVSVGQLAAKFQAVKV